MDSDLGSSSNVPNLMSFKSSNQSEVDGTSAAVGLGDLASLTVANESENGAGRSLMLLSNFSYLYFIN